MASEEKLNLLTRAAAESYPAFVRAAWMQPTIDDHRSKTIAALGLMGEAGEVCEVIKKRVRGDEGAHVSDEKLLLELGDVWFYFNLVHLQWGFVLFGLDEIREKYNLPLRPFAHQEKLAWVASDLMLSCASMGDFLTTEIISTPGKAQLSKTNFGTRVQQIRAAMRFLLDLLGVNQTQLEATNVKKLTDRYRNQGTLRGSGSDR